MTVAGCTVPSGSNTCVMPTFLPMMPVTISRLRCGDSGLGIRDSPERHAASEACDDSPFTIPNESQSRITNPELLVLFPKRLDLHVPARRQIELHQRVH